MRSLGQFSFSRYDNNAWDSTTIKGERFPSYYEDGQFHVVTQDHAVHDMPIHDAQETILQNGYDNFISAVNKKMKTHFEMKVAPDYYGSVFIYWVCPVKEDKKLCKFLEQVVEDALYHHPLIGSDYCAFVEALMEISGDALYERMGDAEDDEEKVRIAADYVENIVAAGYELCEENYRELCEYLPEEKVRKMNFLNALKDEAIVIPMPKPKKKVVAKKKKVANRKKGE